jgi:hypothetical protein
MELIASVAGPRNDLALVHDAPHVLRGADAGPARSISTA